MERILRLAQEFVAKEVLPNAGAWEAERRMADQEIRAAIRCGLGSLLVPQDKGGHGLSIRGAASVLEILAAADFPFAFSLEVHNGMAGALATRGSPDQVKRYLSAIVDGSILVSFCLTEPQSGSDATSVKTTARREGNRWVLNGTKAWVTSAHAADLFCVNAQTNPSAGPAGVAGFLVERTALGLSVGPPYELIGCHSMGLADVHLNDCVVEDGAIYAPPGQGFREAMAGIDQARVFVAAMCCGMLKASLEEAIGYASRRVAFGKAIMEFQGVQWMLSEIATDLHAGRLMAYHAADRIDAQQRGTVEAAHAKKFATRVALQGVAQCMQAMGATALRAGTAISRHFAAAKAAQFLDGTTEIQNIVIARSLSAKST